MSDKLTAKQERWCLEYIVDLNAAQAAVRAGYSAHSAKQQGTENLSKPSLMARVAELQRPVLEQVVVDAAYVLRQARKLHERCMQELSPVTERVDGETVFKYDDEGRQVFRFDASGAAKALEILGKHVAVQAFSESKKVTHSFADMAPEELDAVIAALLNK